MVARKMPELPNLFVVGAAKAGTTAIYHYFKAHAQIYVSENVKEANYMAYFDGLPHFTGPGDMTAGPGNSVTNLADYLDLYADRKDELVAADVSPCYLHLSQAAGKIAALCPRAKIVMVLRNPIESALSMFSMMYRDRRESCDSFVEAFHRSQQRIAAGWEWAWDYQNCFMYSQQVARYLNLFPREQLFIRRYGELKNTPEKFYGELTEFIGVENWKLQDANQWVNTAARRWDRLRRTRRGKILAELARAARKLLPRTICKRLGLNLLEQPAFRLSVHDRRVLVAHFQDDVRRLATLLKWNLDDWLRVDDAGAAAESHVSCHATKAA